MRGASVQRIAIGDHANLDAVAWDASAQRFLVGGDGGRVLAVSLAGDVTPLPSLDPPRAVTGVLPWRGGVLVGGWQQTGAPYRFRGTLAFSGPDDVAPSKVREPVRQELPAPRTRTVALDVTTFLGADDGQLIPLADAKAKLPAVAWPDTNLERVRFYAGNVHVATTDELLASTEESGYAVAIAGHLVVDGALDAVAGGDGYDSVLVVDGDVWAASAIFRGTIKASFKGTLEVAKVVLCSHGDDGGTLWCNALRAQVLAYSCYFPKPECELDCFCIGDVYGDKSFPPSRSEEVFVPSVLEGTCFDESSLADALRDGVHVLVR